MMRKSLALAALMAAGLMLAGGPAEAQRTKLTIYTAAENEQLPPFKAAIEKAVPEVEVEWVRDSTGVITARVLAEKANPRADVIFGLAASSLLIFNKHGLLEAYQAKGADKLKAAFRSKDGSFTGMDAFLGIVCYNTVEGGKAGATVPAAWKDLLSPKLKGQIVMPHPGSSGTGYLMVAAWLQTMGEQAGWKYMDDLHQNVAVYTHSGSAPCVLAAKGERIVGIGFDMRGAREKSNGAPIELIVPAEGTGWDMEATAIMKSTRHMALAKRVADWAASEEANRLYAKDYAIVAHPAINTLPKNYPANGEARMAKIDLQVMANERERILAEWSKRYEAKAAPKK